MSGDNFIPVWSDREGSVGLDTGHKHPQSKQPIIEMINGEARGSLDWVRSEFGPLTDLSARTRAERWRATRDELVRLRAEKSA